MKIKTLLILLLLSIVFGSCQNTQMNYKSLDDYPATSDALWLEYSTKASVFRIWSPIAESVQLHLYKEGHGGKPMATHSLLRKKDGLWELSLEGDFKGTYYTYQVKTKDQLLRETPGIYAQAVGLNGERAMVIDLKSTDPEGWDQDKGPEVGSPNEAILYEVHVRDFSIDPLSGIQKKGGFLGLAEKGTKVPGGLASGIDHIKELGITHVHLLPTYDFNSVDESQLNTAQYNWGYDPLNYNALEGSYSTDPSKAEVRIKEFKQMIQAFHNDSIGVVLDVVYNHTALYEHSNFNLEVPAYYYRHWEDGSPSNASACGNEFASERKMAQKFIVESVSYWAREYHVDGFRFDLMAILDIETMNQISKALKDINPNIIIYGEGWAASDSPYPFEKRAFKVNVAQMPDVSAFSDELRDGLKGSVFEERGLGFVSGAEKTEESVKMGIVGCIEHPQIENATAKAWASEPWQSLAYVSCHDNHTLYDKLKISRPDAREEEWIAMDKLANAVVLTSQGISFIHAGAEMLRTKQGVENSYKSPDSINQIDWSWKEKHLQTVAYYKNLIQLRKAHPAFRMKTADEVRKNLAFKTVENGLLSYQISHNANGDTWKNIYVVYNARPEAVEYLLPGKWTLAVVGDDFNANTIVEGRIEVRGRTMLIAFQP